MSRRSIKYATKGGKKDKSYSVSQMTRGRFSAPRSSTTMQAMRTGGWASPSGPELKYIDTNANTAITFASSAFATGILLTQLQEIGRKMVMKSLLLRWSWNLASTSTGGSQ